MNICILDGYTTNPGDVSWAPLEALGNVTIYEFTKPDEIVERAKYAEIKCFTQVTVYWYAVYGF